MKFSYRKTKRKFAKVSYYNYRGTEVGYYIFINSDVQLYEDQLSLIYEIVRDSKPFNPYFIAQKIVTEIGEPISKASFEYDETTIHIELREWPYD